MYTILHFFPDLSQNHSLRHLRIGESCNTRKSLAWKGMKWEQFSDESEARKKTWKCKVQGQRVRSHQKGDMPRKNWILRRSKKGSAAISGIFTHQKYNYKICSFFLSDVHFFTSYILYYIYYIILHVYSALSNAILMHFTMKGYTYNTMRTKLM